MAKKKKINKQLESLAIGATRYIGTPISIIIHTVIFALFAFALWDGLDFNKTLLVWNTMVSLEAIYLALFIQLTVNKNTQSLEGVEEDIEEIAEDVEGIEGDVEGLEGNLKRMRHNMKELEEDIEDISEDVDKIVVEESSEEELIHIQSNKSLKNIEKEILTLSTGILALRDDLEVLKRTIK